MERYSLKMRASNIIDGHISGAENIVKEEELEYCYHKLLKRALEHSKGKPDFINVKIEKIREEDIIHLKALPVKTIKTKTVEEGQAVIFDYLKKLHLKHIKEIQGIWNQSYAMRGAVLLHADTLKHLEPDCKRGIRVTYMDMEGSHKQQQSIFKEKDHFKEALILATKVANHPNIVAELCISDDPHYVTGYIASKQFGYVRITTLKKLGSSRGGRVFLFRGNDKEINECINYLEEQKVLVHTDW